MLKMLEWMDFYINKMNIDFSGIHLSLGILIMVI